MVRKISALTLLACLSVAPAAHAADHFITIVGDDYFPDFTYVAPGDIVHFVNETGQSQRVYSKSRNSSSSWNAPTNLRRLTLLDSGRYTDIQYTVEGVVCDPDECFSIEIVPGMDFSFSDNYYYDEASKYASIKWGPAPLD